MLEPAINTATRRKPSFRERRGKFGLIPNCRGGNSLLGTQSSALCRTRTHTNTATRRKPSFRDRRGKFGLIPNCRGGNSLLDNGAPGMTRTFDLRLRSPLLYPTELRGHAVMRQTYGFSHRAGRKTWFSLRLLFSLRRESVFQTYFGTRGAGAESRTPITSLENWDNNRYTTPARPSVRIDLVLPFRQKLRFDATIVLSESYLVANGSLDTIL